MKCHLLLSCHAPVSWLVQLWTGCLESQSNTSTVWPAPAVCMWWLGGGQRSVQGDASNSAQPQPGCKPTAAALFPTPQHTMVTKAPHLRAP